MLNRRNLKVVTLGFLAAAGALWLRGQYLYNHPSQAENSAAQAYSQALERADPVHGFVTDYERRDVEASTQEMARLREDRIAKHANANLISILPLAPAALCGLVPHQKINTNGASLLSFLTGKRSSKLSATF